MWFSLLFIMAFFSIEIPLLDFFHLNEPNEFYIIRFFSSVCSVGMGTVSNATVLQEIPLCSQSNSQNSKSTVEPVDIEVECICFNAFFVWCLRFYCVAYDFCFNSIRFYFSFQSLLSIKLTIFVHPFVLNAF